MRYQEIVDEYRELIVREINLRTELRGISKGYLVTKNISGKSYLYLQYSDQGKKKSEYIPAKDHERVRIAIARRKLAKEELDAVLREQHRLESAAKILDANLHRTITFLKQGAEMDALPLEKRQEALSFSQAMTAIEGLPTKAETEERLQLWASGEGSFSDIYIELLQSYRILE